jgi:hypothetical protein
MAPLHSDGEESHAPSTQLPPCTTVSVIVRGIRFADSSVPIQFPATFAKPPGLEAGTVGAVEELQPTWNSTAATNTATREGTLACLIFVALRTIVRSA